MQWARASNGGGGAYGASGPSSQLHDASGSNPAAPQCGATKRVGIVGVPRGPVNLLGDHEVVVRLPLAKEQVTTVEQRSRGHVAVHTDSTPIRGNPAAGERASSIPV